MSDRIVRGILTDTNTLVVACVVTDAAREARRRHGLAPSSAALLGEGLCAVTMIGTLQKTEATRINLQLECTGPAGGLFVDGDTQGRCRGYVRSKAIRFPPEPRFRTSPLLGSSGYVSVLRDVNGEFYRGNVDLVDGDLSVALEHYFAQSEQVETALQLEALVLGDDELGWVGGLLVQALPGSDPASVAALRDRLRAGAIEDAVRSGKATAHQLLTAVVGAAPLDLLYDGEASYYCTCTRERVLRALSTLTNLDLIEMIQQDHKAEADCDFCGAHYVIGEAELHEVLDFIDARDAAREAPTGRKPDPGAN